MSQGVGLISLGCARNLVDSQCILSRLKKKGFRLTEIPKARIALVNTCAFIKEAKEESINLILDLIDLKKKGKLEKLIVYGCLAQRYGDKLIKELKEVDAFVGRISLNAHSRLLNSKSGLLGPSHYAYLKICEGCQNYCSYCAIPRIKGRLVSRRQEEIIEEVRRLNQRGVSEINIIGQDITLYGMDIYAGPRLPHLLEAVIKAAPCVFWIRLLYTHPARISSELIKLIAQSPKVCKYIDLPLQHINDRILRLMNRKISKSQTLKLIQRLRREIPEVIIRTSLIVGFPSETDKEFKELLQFIEDVSFERLGVFIYSREEGTPAFDFKGQIPLKVKKERFNAIMSKQRDIASRINASFLDKELDVLIDERMKDGYYLARSYADAPEVDGVVYVKSKERLKPGDFLKVKIKDSYEYDLVGEKI